MNEIGNTLIFVTLKVTMIALEVVVRYISRFKGWESGQFVCVWLSYSKKEDLAIIMLFQCIGRHDPI